MHSLRVYGMRLMGYGWNGSCEADAGDSMQVHHTLDNQRDRLVAEHHRLEDQHAAIEHGDAAMRHEYLRQLQQHVTRLHAFHDELMRQHRDLHELRPEQLPTFVAATRALLGVGVGLLLSEPLPAVARRAIAFTLLATGAATAAYAIRQPR
jgi:hypothetical protein